MKRYYYHGFDSTGYIGIDLECMLQIIESGGIATRDVLRGDKDANFHHVCLYKKNENIDYNSETEFLKSARSGWIDHCLVFIISPDIEAKYMIPNMKMEGRGLPTNLIDEWRCFENIPLDKIVGIALPFDTIKECLEQETFFDEEEEQDQLKAKKCLQILNDTCKHLGFIVANSDEPNFTDKLDLELQSQKSHDDLSEDLIM